MPNMVIHLPCFQPIPLRFKHKINEKLQEVLSSSVDRKVSMQQMASSSLMKVKCSSENLKKAVKKKTRGGMERRTERVNAVHMQVCIRDTSRKPITCFFLKLSLILSFSLLLENISHLCLSKHTQGSVLSIFCRQSPHLVAPFQTIFKRPVVLIMLIC